MNKFDPYVALAQFAGSLPTLIAVLLAWMHSNGRFGDLNARFNELNARLSTEIAGLNRRIDDTRDLLRSEFQRVEELMDGHLKHLEERER